MNRATSSRRHQIPQRWEPAKARILVILTGSEEQVRRSVVVDILAVDCILDIDWALAFTQDCRIGSEEDTSNANDMRYWARQEGDQGDEDAQTECAE